MKYIALQLPGGQSISAPGGIPQGGLNVTSEAIRNAVTIMIILAVILALIFLIWGGIQWITSEGDKTKVASARKRITFAIVGLLITLGSFLIVNVIGDVFNIHLLGAG